MLLVWGKDIAIGTKTSHGCACQWQRRYPLASQPPDTTTPIMRMHTHRFIYSKRTGKSFGVKLTPSASQAMTCTGTQGLTSEATMSAMNFLTSTEGFLSVIPMQTGI